MQQKRQHAQQPQTGMPFNAHQKHHGRPCKNIVVPENALLAG